MMAASFIACIPCIQPMGTLNVYILEISLLSRITIFLLNSVVNHMHHCKDSVVWSFQTDVLHGWMIYQTQKQIERLIIISKSRRGMSQGFYFAVWTKSWQCLWCSNRKSDNFYNPQQHTDCCVLMALFPRFGNWFSERSVALLGQAWPVSSLSSPFPWSFRNVHVVGFLKHAAAFCIHALAIFFMLMLICESILTSQAERMSLTSFDTLIIVIVHVGKQWYIIMSPVSFFMIKTTTFMGHSK